jgi:hypothetical protein
MGNGFCVNKNDSIDNSNKFSEIKKINYPINYVNDNNIDNYDIDDNNYDNDYDKNNYSKDDNNFKNCTDEYIINNDSIQDKMAKYLIYSVVIHSNVNIIGNTDEIIKYYHKKDSECIKLLKYEILSEIDDLHKNDNIFFDDEIYIDIYCDTYHNFLNNQMDLSKTPFIATYQIKIHINLFEIHLFSDISNKKIYDFYGKYSVFDSSKNKILYTE